MGMLWGWKLPQMRAPRACVPKGLHVCNPAYGALEEPRSPPSTPRMRAAFEESPPEAFRRRNLILSHSALFHSFAQSTVANGLLKNSDDLETLFELAQEPRRGIDAQESSAPVA